MFGWLSKLTNRRPPLPRRDLLNLGCGSQIHEDWLNVDLSADDPRVFAHDLREPLPFADASFSAVYHSHVLEHLPRRDAPRFLAECFRLVKPGGILRVVVPDLETIARLYLENLDRACAGDEAAAARYEWMTIELLDQLTRDRPGGEMAHYWRQQPMPAGDFVFDRTGNEARQWIEAQRHAPTQPPDGEPSAREVARFRATGEVHRWMYDRCSLGRLLAGIGFIDIRVCAAGESSIPGFAAYHFDVQPDGRTRKPDSLFMEARKPAA